MKGQSEANRSYCLPAADDEREFKSINLIFGREGVKEVFMSRSRLDLFMLVSELISIIVLGSWLGIFSKTLFKNLNSWQDRLYYT